MSYHIRAEQYNHTFTLLHYMYQWNFTEKTFKSSFSYTFIMIDLNTNIEFKNFVYTFFKITNICTFTITKGNKYIAC